MQFILIRGFLQNNDIKEYMNFILVIKYMYIEYNYKVVHQATNHSHQALPDQVCTKYDHAVSLFQYMYVLCKLSFTVYCISSWESHFSDKTIYLHESMTMDSWMLIYTVPCY